VWLCLGVTYLLSVASVYEGGQSGHLDVQPHWVTALAWPQSKGLIEGCLGLTIDSLLIGRVDGSVAVIEVFDSSTFCRKELQHCSRTGGKWDEVLSIDFLRVGLCTGVYLKYIFPFITCHTISHILSKLHHIQTSFASHRVYVLSAFSKCKTEMRGFINSLISMTNRLPQQHLVANRSQPHHSKEGNSCCRNVNNYTIKFVFWWICTVLL